VAAATEMSMEETRRLLDVLAEASLLDDAFDGYRISSLVGLHAREMAQEEESERARQETVRRWVGWWLESARRASHVVTPYRKIPVQDGGLEFGDKAQALDWMEAEFRNLRTAAQAAHAVGLHDTAWNLVDAIWPLFLHRGFHAERLEVDQLGLEAARACGDRKAEAQMLDRTGLSWRYLRRFEKANSDYQEALTIWRALGNRRRVAGSHRRLGQVAMAQGYPSAAIGLFTTAIEGYREMGESRSQALGLADLGRAMIENGRWGEAIPYLTQAQDLLADTDDLYNLTRARILLGHAQLRDEVVAAGLQTMRALGSASGEALALQSLGEIAMHAGQMTEALGFVRQASTVLTQMGTEPLARLSRLMADIEVSLTAES
jgi:tetratricopeptide (TPR) repeat protein